MIGHIQFAERLADGPVGGNDDAFPTRLDLLRATKNAFPEIEVLIHEITRELRGHRINEMPAQICFPIVQRCVGKECVCCFEEFRLMHIDVAGFDQIDVLEVIRPIPIRRERLHFALLHLVIIFLWIAQFDAGARRLSQRSFQGQDFLCLIGGLARRVAKQCEHLAHMIDILVAQFF